jgi:hypothetical protein
MRRRLNPGHKFHHHYPRYIGWSFATNILVSTESILGAHSMLSAVGKESTELAVSFNYLGKDLFGQMGGLWYMYKMGGEADRKPKRFINKAMVTQQASIVLECVTPLISSSAFIPVASVATIGRNISATGLGAINAKSIQYMAGTRSIGEMYAQITTVNTLATTIGMAIGLAIAAKIPDHSTRLCLLPFITGIRIWTYKKAINGLLDEFKKLK